MKILLKVITLVFISVQVLAQSANADQELLQLSKDKWQWMADKNVEKLKDLLMTNLSSSTWADHGAKSKSLM